MTNIAPKTGRDNNNLGDSNSGGLIGYGGTGVVANNMKVIGANSSSVIGSIEATANASGMVAFAQNQSEEGEISSVTLTNCHVEKINITGNLNAGGFFAKSWEDKWSPSFCHFIDCSVKGEINNDSDEPIYKIYGVDTSNSTGGGFIASARASSKSTNSYSNIDKCHITGYKIEAANAGGMAGNVKNKPLHLTNSYIEDCVIASKSVSGGFVSYLENSVLGYNLMTKNIKFTNANSGHFIGNANSKTVQLIGVAKYADDNQLNNIKTSDIYSNSNSPFIVYGDYKGTSETDIINKTGSVSSFTNSNNVDQPFAPFLTVNPRETLGTDEYITSDGAGINSAGLIYRDVKEASSNRRYTIGNTEDPSSGTNDETTLKQYINDDGSYKVDGAFKISTALDQFRTLPSGVENFAMLVINDDSAKADDITPFIKSYIRLVTNTPGRVAQADYSCGNAEINELYVVNVSPCYYDDNVGRFVLGTTGAQGLSYTTGTNYGKYVIDSAKADSASSNPYQFSLIDVQFKDPTDTSGTKIAYHLYVPVYTKKIPAVDFSAVSMSETRYYRSNYTNRISSEINAGKTPNNPSQLVESTNEWTTTFIRYTYPKNQIDANADWNFDKSITLTLDANFKTLPIGTKMILVDPNANADKFYTLTINEAYATNTAEPLPLSNFVDEKGKPFAPQSLSKIMESAEATSTAEGHTNDLYEDYYISMYVPKAGEGYTHSIIVGCGSEMACTGRDDKANITSKLYSRVVLGDLFTHSIKSFTVESSDGTTYRDNPEMTAANHILRTKVTATVQIKDRNAGNYLAGSDVYHSFFITLTSHDAEKKVSDIIYGINSGNISNTTKYTYTDSTDHTKTVTESFLGTNYIQLNTGNILDALYDSQSFPVVTIESETTMSFYDVTAFPYNISGANGIGTQVSVKSSLAYREEDLLYSAMNIPMEDPEGKFYYSTTQNSAELSFNSVPTDDKTDEIGLKTNNKSLLGVNGKYGTSHPIIGLAIYNVDDIIDYDSATEVVYKITLYKKVTDENGTRYDQVSNISKYLSDVKLTDDEVGLTADRTNSSEYVYTGKIDHKQQADLDKMFDVDFSCNVLTGDAGHNEYANYKIRLTAELDGASNSWKDSFIIYTNAKFDPSVIDEIIDH